MRTSIIVALAAIILVILVLGALIVAAWALNAWWNRKEWLGTPKRKRPS